MTLDYYDEWNLLLLNEYFNEANRGESVWIQTSREELNSFGFRYGGADGLIEAVRLGPSWLRKFSSDIAYTVYMLRYQREYEIQRPDDYGDPGKYSDSYSHLDAPTYLPYLALWVLAASEEGSSGFYDKISQLTGLPFRSSEDNRNAMWRTWSDLDAWSKILEGEYGNFTAAQLGNHAYVGLAKAQALLTQKDRKELPRLFSQHGFRPNQKLTDREFEILKASGRDQYFLSRGLREAFNNDEIFGDAVREILNARLGEWDGRWSNQGENKTSNNNIALARLHENDETPIEEILPLSITLSLLFDGWKLGLRINSHLPGSQFKLSCLGIELSGTIDAYRDTIDCIDNSKSGQAAVWEILDKISGNEEMILNGEYISDTDDNSRISLQTVLKSVVCHSLAWTNTRDEQILVEVPLPITGPVYLLTKESSVEDKLNTYAINYIKLINEDRIGLTENWQLLVVEQTEKLTPEMRSAIQRLTGDQSGAEDRPRIRFVSGCVIMRGGSRQYTDYDLPLVEIEMPEGAVIESEGLSLIRIEENTKGKNKNYSEFYRIERCNKNIFQYLISVRHGNEILSSSKLKIASSSVHSQTLRRFSIGKFGDSLNSEEGLKGIIIEDRLIAEPSAKSAGIMTAEMREALFTSMEMLNPQDNLTCLFLDLLAQKGSIPYGEVKLLLGRLAEQLKIRDISPISVLFDLRSLAFLDIETDQKGHLVRVHAAPPVVYRLLYDDPDGNPCWSVGGTLRLDQWESLVTMPGLDVFVSYGLVPSLLITAHSIQAVIEELRANLIFGVSDSIITFSSNLDDFKARLLSQRGDEQYRPNNLERFNPLKAYFSFDRSGIMKVDRDRSYELFKLDDPVISKMKVYMLGIYDENRSIYSVIPDSRWSVWMTITSFGEMLYQRNGVNEAYPWPLCYLSDTADLIIPARMKPPMLIDRALCMASGNLPDKLSYKFEVGSNNKIGFTIHLESNKTKKIYNVPLAYYEMADGIWLRYRLISKDLVEKIANKLSCDVSYM